MIITGNDTFTLGWDPPVATDMVDQTDIYEIVDTNFNVVSTVPQPANQATLTGVQPGTHKYVAKFHNAAGFSASYSNEVDVLVLALPATVTNLTLITP